MMIFYVTKYVTNQAVIVNVNITIQAINSVDIFLA